MCMEEYMCGICGICVCVMYACIGDACRCMCGVYVYEVFYVYDVCDRCGVSVIYCMYV